MDKAIAWAKGHPKTLLLVVVGVLVLMFWPKSKAVATDTTSGTTNSAAVADAVAQSQQANAALQVSHDQVQIAGLQAATSQANTANANAAAVSIASIEAQAASASAAASVQLGQLSASTAALQTIAPILTVTQKQANDAGNLTDAAGFGLQQMFANLLNFEQGKQTIVTNIVQDRADPVLSTFIGDKGLSTITQITPADAHGNGFKGVSLDAVTGANVQYRGDVVSTHAPNQ